MLPSDRCAEAVYAERPRAEARHIEQPLRVPSDLYASACASRPMCRAASGAEANMRGVEWGVNF